MLKIDFENLVNLIRKDFDLFPDNLKSWNINYLEYQKNRYKSELRILEGFERTNEILEIGSLPYHMTFFLSKSGFNVTGLDLNPERGKAFIEKHCLNVLACDIEREKLPFEDGHFDIVLFMEVFEHLRIDPIFTMNEINRVIRPGGTLILSTPNLYKLSNVLNFLLGRSYLQPYSQFEKLYTTGHMGHVHEYSRGELRTFLEKTNFRNIKISYRSYRIKWNKFYLYLPQHLIPFFRPYMLAISKKGQ